VVLEEWLEGEEASVLAFVDGEEVRALVPSQDHKRAFDGDRGPNTGGMGAHAPYPPLAGGKLEEVLESCIRPIARAFARRGVLYRGVLYAGLMLTKEGPRVLEYNVRFGDPETQAVLPLFEGDLLETIAACARGELAEAEPFGVRLGAALTVVAASGGYPGSYETGFPIEGLPEEAAAEAEGVLVFHAGTRRREDERIVTSGGRVLAVTGLGATLAEAHRVAYDVVRRIRFEGMFTRTDIGAQALGMAAASKGESC
jgi:phosphoribosylamine--glycine ligase